MCFSANASFAAAGTLSLIGLLSVHAARHNKKLIPFAAIPLFFAAQQACEGLVWITLNNGDTASILHSVGIYGFLFFASAWWPIWIPFTLYIAEKLPARKILIKQTLYMGIATSIMLFIAWTLHTTGPQIVDHHINYPVPHYPFGITNNYIAQTLSWVISAMYIIATVLPFFISSIAYTHVAGIIASVGLAIAYIFYLAAFPSVWCFFEGISSILIYFVVKNNKE
jgi:hypothetical protein